MNVVLLAIDTLRADHLGCYGYKRDTSPFIDHIARDSVLFERFYAPNIPTHPSFTTMHSGKEAITHNIVNIGAKAQPSPHVRLLAEILHDADYFTVAVDNMRRHFPRGFDVYKDYTWDRSQSGILRKAESVNAQLFPVLDILSAQKKPFFLFIHYWDPHTPYLPPPPYNTKFYPEGHNPYDKTNTSMDKVWEFEPFRWYFHSWMPGVTDTKFVNAQYDGEIRYLDDHLRPAIEAMDQHGLLKDTIVFITADHGEVLDEHEGYYDHHGLYDTNIHIPLLVWSPPFLPRGRRVHGFCQNLDLAQTILELCEVPDTEHMEGKSLVPSLYGLRDGNYREMYFSEASWQVKRAVRTEQWKFIKALLPSFHVGSPERELYNLEADPDEQHNLAERHPEIVAELEAKLDDYVGRRLSETGRSIDPCIEQGVSGTRIGTPPTDLENYGRNYLPPQEARQQQTSPIPGLSEFNAQRPQ